MHLDASAAQNPIRLTRRVLLGTLGGLLAFRAPLRAAEPVSEAQTTHWLNDRSCLGWWLMRPSTYTSTTWHALLRGADGIFTAMASPSTPTDGPYQPTTRRGGLADVRCNGTGGHVLVPGLLGTPATVTLTMWAAVTDVDTSGADLINIGDNVGIRINTLGVPRPQYRYASGTHFMDGPADMRNTGWHALAYVVQPGAQTLYIDGRVVVTAAAVDAISYTGTGTNTTFGKHAAVASTTFDLTGFLDDVRIYNRPLAAAEVALLWQDALLGYPTLLRDPAASAPLSVARHRRRGQLW